MAGLEIIVHPTDAIQAEILGMPPSARRAAVRERLGGLVVPMLERVPGGAGNDPAAWLEQAGLFPIEAAGDAEREGLDVLRGIDAWGRCAEALDRSIGIFEAAGYEPPVPPRLDFGLLLGNRNDPDLIDRHGGSTGFGGFPGLLLVLIWPTDDTIRRLPAVVAHEFHHQARLGYEPWSDGTTVGAYLALEGLAESFAGALYGESRLGPWVTRHDADTVARAKAIIAPALGVSGFDRIRGYLFGDDLAERYGYEPVGLPHAAGYAVGYGMVQTYLRATGATIVEATLTPSDEIVAAAEEAGYFA